MLLKSFLHSRSLSQLQSSNNTKYKPRHCQTCYDSRHTTATCWYSHSKQQSKSFKRKHPNAKVLYKKLKKAQRINKKWQKSHPKRKSFSTQRLSQAFEKDKNNTWYLDSAAAAHTTYNLKDYVYPDLDNLREIIETPNRKVLYTRGAGTVAFEIMINNTFFYVHLKNVHYCPETISNLLSLGIFKAKGFEFKTKNGYLNIKNTAGEMKTQGTFAFDTLFLDLYKYSGSLHAGITAKSFVDRYAGLCQTVLEFQQHKYV